MAKKNQVVEQEEHFDLMSFDEEVYPNDMVAEAMSGMIEASNKQMMIAVELTKLIVGNNTVENMEEHVFSVFERAVKVVEENSAFKNLMEQFER